MQRFVLLTIAVIVAILFVTGFFSPLFRYAGNAFDNLRLSFDRGDGFPTQLELPEVSDAVPVGSGAVIVGQNELLFLSDSAKQVRRIGHVFAQPIITSNDNGILMYSRGSNQIKIEGFFENLLTLNTSQEVFSAALANSGSFALALSDDRFKSSVAVYSSVGTELFNYRLAEELPVALEFSDNSRLLAMSTVSALDAELTGKIYVLSLPDSELISTIDFGTGLCTELHFSGSDIIAVTDDSVRRYDVSSGEETARYDFDGKQLLKISVSPDSEHVAVLLGEEGLAMTQILTVLNANLVPMGEIVPTFTIDNISSTLYNLNVSTDNRILTYNFNLETNPKEDVYANEPITTLLSNGLAIGSEQAYLIN